MGSSINDVRLSCKVMHLPAKVACVSVGVCGVGVCGVCHFEQRVESTGAERRASKLGMDSGCMVIERE